MQRERLIGLGVLVLGLVIYFVLIPIGIDSPDEVDPITTAPYFWPRIVAAIITLMGAAAILRPKPGKLEEDEGAPPSTPWRVRIPRLALVLLALFGFYFGIETFGMVVPGVLLTLILMRFAGETRWPLTLTISTLVPVLLYLFFVKVANIPIPLGVFDPM